MQTNVCKDKASKKGINSLPININLIVNTPFQNALVLRHLLVYVIYGISLR